jgi:hypothetical protein
MPSGDILKASLEATFAGEPVVMDLGFVSNSGLGTFEEDADALNTELDTALGLSNSASNFYAPLSVQFTLRQVRIQDLAPGLAAGRVYGKNIPGANAVDDATSPHDALCVTWRTGLKGKQNRGRTYLCGMAEDSENAGFWIPEIQAWANDIFAFELMSAFGPLGSGNYSLSVVHTVSGGARLIPPTATPISGYTINNTVRALRRRAVGVRISRRRTVH